MHTIAHFGPPMSPNYIKVLHSTNERVHDISNIEHDDDPPTFSEEIPT